MRPEGKDSAIVRSHRQRVGSPESANLCRTLHLPPHCQPQYTSGIRARRSQSCASGTAACGAGAMALAAARGGAVADCRWREIPSRPHWLGGCGRRRAYARVLRTWLTLLPQTAAGERKRPFSCGRSLSRRLACGDRLCDDAAPHFPTMRVLRHRSCGCPFYFRFRRTSRAAALSTLRVRRYIPYPAGYL
jgi:hypothetical protein